MAQALEWLRRPDGAPLAETAGMGWNQSWQTSIWTELFFF